VYQNQDQDPCLLSFHFFHEANAIQITVQLAIILVRPLLLPWWLLLVRYSTLLVLFRLVESPRPHGGLTLALEASGLGLNPPRRTYNTLNPTSTYSILIL
jgi:hypothetical protein